MFSMYFSIQPLRWVLNGAAGRDFTNSVYPNSEMFFPLTVPFNTKIPPIYYWHYDFTFLAGLYDFLHFPTSHSHTIQEGSIVTH